MKNIYFLVLTFLVCHASVANGLSAYNNCIVTDPTLPTLSNLIVCDNNNDGFSVFDLSFQNIPILAAQSSAANNYSVSYYETLTHATTSSNPIANLNSYYNINPNSQVIYFSIRHVTTNAFIVGQFQIIVNERPFALGPQIYLNCDSDSNPYNGVSEINLAIYSSVILSEQNPSFYSVTYYTTLVNANAGVSPIISETNYVASNGQTIWVRVQNNATGCYALTSVNITIESQPNPIITTVNNVNNICVNFYSNTVIRALTLNSGILNSSSYSFQWYENDTLIVGSNNSTYTVDTSLLSGATRIYTVKVTSNTPLGCQTTSVPFSVLQSGQAHPIENTNGYSIINLSGVQSIVVTISGYGIYEYSLDNGARQNSDIFENVSLGYHTITVWDTQGGLNYSCDPLIIVNVMIETSQIPAPTGLNSQSFAIGSTLTNIALLGQNIQWYASPNNNASPLPLNTVLVDGVTYYATQTVGGIESSARLAVAVQITLGVTTNDVIPLYFSPNPVENLLNLQSNVTLKLVTVYNFIGQKVYENSLNDTHVVIDLSNLPFGNYIAKVRGETAHKVIKIVKR